MRDSQADIDRELTAFRFFAERSGLPLDPTSIEKRHPPEPDIRCNQEGLAVAFELVELCDDKFAEATNQRVRLSAGAMWFEEPDFGRIKGKFKKEYRTDAPIELLCYTDERMALQDGALVDMIKHAIDFHDQRTFRRAWFMGQRVECLFEVR